MTPFEISVLGTLIATCGGVIIGVMKIIGGQTAAKTALVASDRKKPSDPPPRVDHGPCNAAVEELTEVLRDDMRERKIQTEASLKEQREFRELFVRWMAREEGRREAMARTNEFPAVG